MFTTFTSTLKHMKITGDNNDRIQIFFDTIDFSKLDEVFIYSNLINIRSTKSYLKLLDVLIFTKISSYFDNPLNIPKDNVITPVFKKFDAAYLDLFRFIQKVIKSNALGIPPNFEYENEMHNLVRNLNSCYRDILLTVDDQLTKIVKEDRYKQVFETKEELNANSQKNISKQIFYVEGNDIVYFKTQKPLILKSESPKFKSDFIKIIHSFNKKDIKVLTISKIFKNRKKDALRTGSFKSIKTLLIDNGIQNTHPETSDLILEITRSVVKFNNYIN